MADLETPDGSQEQIVEPTGTETEVTPDPAAAPAEELTPEQLRANLTRANEQAAAERVKRQEALTELNTMREKLGSMKSVEEVEAVVSEYAQKLADAETATSRLLAAQAAGLPAGMEKRLSGSTYEELLADAKDLAQSVAPPKTPPAPLPLGGGRDPKPDPDDKPGDGYRAAKDKHAY